MILGLLSATCALLPVAYGTPLLPVTTLSTSTLHRRQEIIPTNPHQGQPYCAADTQDKKNCNDGDTIIEINANDPLPPPPQVGKSTDSFTDLVTSINQGNLTGPSLAACKPGTTGQDPKCRPQLTIDDYTLELDPDPTSNLSLTLDFSAAKDACPFARLPDYEFLSGQRRGTKANATLYEISEDVTAANQADFLARMDEMVDKLVKDHDRSFEDSWGVSFYDYAGINGTSLDMRIDNGKNRRSIRPRHRVPSNIGNNPMAGQIINNLPNNFANNLAVAARVEGSIRLALFGAVPTILALVFFNQFTQTDRPRMVNQPNTWTPAFQQGAGVVSGMMLGILLQNIRDRWRPGQGLIRPIQGLLIVIAVKVLAFLAAAVRRGAEWLANALRGRMARRDTAALPSLEERQRAISALLSGAASTSNPLQLELPQPKPEYQPAEIALGRLGTVKDQMLAWRDSMQNTCQSVGTAFEAARAAGNNPNQVAGSGGVETS